MNQKLISVELMILVGSRQKLWKKSVHQGTTLWELLEKTPWEDFFSFSLEQCQVGVFSSIVKNPKDYILSEGERVEVYQPLKIEPKEAKELVLAFRQQKAKNNQTASISPKNDS